MDMDGNVFISDFGVSASLKKGQTRNTFVGSPCWMAPEVMEQTGHDYKADIWSLGVTAIELAQGNAPYSDMTAMKVILEILNKDPPQLGSTRPWDSCFRHFIEDCLQKDPTKRPTIDQLFANHKKFFAKAKTPQFLKENFLQDLKEVFHRMDQSLMLQAEEYLNTKRRARVQRIEMESSQKQVQWDFGSGN